MGCEQIISITANVITIIGGCLAFYVFWTWKYQQNYSFVRDKIFECELVYTRSITTIHHYMEIYKDEFPFDVNRINRNNLELTNVRLAETKRILESLWSEYDLALYSLNVLEINYNIDLLPNFIAINGQLNRYKRMLEEAKTLKDVGDAYLFIRESIRLRKTEGLAELKRLRLDL
ncbi:hypothetical protein [Acinetobacter seifertii]|uniref:hypothetical protein n=1 Tax=Acinetobacter seifertii TaxID=1530123 RepID=UPI000C2276B8|nr:hypothetical protein [Acinetobacter seifertii]PJG67812.1 hypothetical protein CVD09_03680 [Acinetobacter seifertii]